MLANVAEVIGVYVVKEKRAHQLGQRVPQYQDCMIVNVDDVAFFAHTHLKGEINIPHSNGEIEEGEVGRQFPEE